MSDLHHDENLQAGGNAPAETEGQQDQQPTRVVPAASDTDDRPAPRRRRSGAGRNVDPEAAAPRARAETRVNATSRPSQAVPRPGAMNRLNRDMPELDEASSASGQPRRPVSAPGYTQRRPLGQTGAAEDSERIVRGDDEMTEEEYQAISAAGSSRRPQGSGIRRAGSQLVSDEVLREVTGERRAAHDPKRPRARRVEDAMEAANYDAMVEGGAEPSRRPVNRALVAAVAGVLVLALIVLGLLLIPNDDPTVLGSFKRALTGAEQQNSAPKAAVLDFSAALTEGTAPMSVQFTLTTNRYAESVRVVNESDEPLSATPIRIDNADTVIWMLTAAISEPYHGRVQAQVQEGGQWSSSGRSLTLKVNPALAASQAPEATAEPTAEPTSEPTAEPTSEPTAEPVVAIAEATEVPVEATMEPVSETLAPVSKPEATETALQETVAPTPTMMTTPVPTMIPMEGFEELIVDDIGDEPVLLDEGNDTPADDESNDMPTGDEPYLIDLGEGEPLDALEGGEDSAAATAEPEETDDLAGEENVGSLPLPEVTAEPAATEAPRLLVAEACEDADPSLLANVAVYNNSGKKLSSYSRDVGDVLNLPVGDAYLIKPFGVLTFRGNASRQNAAVGNVGERLDDLSILWQVKTGSIKSSENKYYYGVDWTGQAAIVKWPKEVRTASNMKDSKKDKTGLREVIVAANDGNIYFLDLENGEATRAALEVGYPMHGTPSIHTLGFPLMTVGQYARKMAGNSNGSIGLRFYNLLNQKQMYMINGIGKEYNPPYSVGSFETSALIDAAADALVAVGTNGVLYLADLNTRFDKNAVELTIKPELTAMTSTIKKQTAKYAAVESSMAMYGSYVFYADMQGILRCVDTTTMTVVWAVDTGDSVEAAIALDMDDDGELWLYTANELSIRSKGDSMVRCYNAMTGELRWETGLGVAKSKKITYTLGVKASPVVGQNGLDDLVYFTVSGLSAAGAEELGLGSEAVPSALLAMDKITGEIAWSMPMQSYTYSSPVAVYNEYGKGWIVQAASDGHVYLLDGVSGELVNELTLDGTIAASPAVYGNIMVLSTTGKNTSYIYGIVLD